MNTGASNHMTENIGIFSELDRGITDTVKFGDGSLMYILERGTIIFSARRGSHRVLTKVYYIPRLRSNIISLGQLDEFGCQVLIDQGVLRVRNQQKGLLAKVCRSQNRLYKITLTIAQPVSLLARTNDNAWRWHERYGHLSPSTRFGSSVTAGWFKVCHSLIMLINYVTHVWPANSVVRRFLKRPSTGRGNDLI